MNARRAGNRRGGSKFEHRDRWAERAQAAGYRARSAWKLLDIQERVKLFRPGECVLELGAAPGGWSQVLQKILGAKGMLIAVDLLDMQPLDGVHTLCGDFREAKIQEEIKRILGKRKIDLVISDISPNITGVDAIDNNAVVALNDEVVEFARGQSACRFCLFKSFQCAELSERIALWRKMFDSVRVLKPDASRAKSREVYLLVSGMQD